MEVSVLGLPTPKVLYHYCPVEAFHQIIMKQSLWHTSVKYFRDSNEATYIENHFDSLLSAFTGSAKDLISELFEGYRDGIEDIYVTCFSPLKDSLSQWRGYTNDAEGVAIGFNPEYFYHFRVDSGLSTVDADFQSQYLEKVIYKEETQRNILMGLIDNVVSYSRKSEAASKIALKNGRLKLRMLGTIMKNPRFHEEREWRLFSFQKFENPDRVERELVGDGFICRNGVIQPVQEIEIRNDNEEKEWSIGSRAAEIAVNQIWFGPRCRLDDKIISRFLQTYGFEFASKRLNRSKASYI